MKFFNFKFKHLFVLLAVLITCINTAWGAASTSSDSKYVMGKVTFESVGSISSGNNYWYNGIKFYPGNSQNASNNTSAWSADVSIPTYISNATASNQANKGKWGKNGTGKQYTMSGLAFNCFAMGIHINKKCTLEVVVDRNNQSDTDDAGIAANVETAVAYGTGWTSSNYKTDGATALTVTSSRADATNTPGRYTLTIPITSSGEKVVKMLYSSSGTGNGKLFCFESVAVYHKVSHSLTNVTKAVGTKDTTWATSNYTATYAAEDGYTLPSTITVTIDGNTQTAGTHYTWNQGTGVLTINKSAMTGGDIVVTITGESAETDHWYIYGNFSDGETWTDTEVAVDGNVDINIPMDAHDYSFKIKHTRGASTWYSGVGEGSYMSRDNHTSWNFNNTYNCGLRTDIGGTYNFALTLSGETPVVTVTYPTGVAVTLDYNYSSLTYSWQAISGEPMPTPPTPSRDSYAFSGWYTTSACTTPVNFDMPITEATTIYAKWDPAWKFVGSLNWSNYITMTRSSNQMYWYYTCTGGSGYEFILYCGSTPYYRDKIVKGYNGTDVTNMNDGDDSSWGIGNNCGVYVAEGTFYIIVYPANTAANSTNSPIICASTFLPNDESFYSFIGGSHKIYFDNSSADWSNIHFRVGRTNHNSAFEMTRVTGTENLYECTPDAYSNYFVYHVANQCAWSGDNSIYTLRPGGSPDYNISKCTVFQRKHIFEDITLTPGDENNTESGVTYYKVSQTRGMKTDNVSITPPTNGSISVTYTSGSGGTLTSGNVDLAHTSILTISASGNTGYDLGTLTVNGESHTSGENYTLSEDAVVAATFTPKVYSVTFHTNSGTINSGNVENYTYGVGATLPTDVTRSGYLFAGWYANSELTGDPVTTIANNATDAKEYWAKWTALSSKCETMGDDFAASEPYGYETINGVEYDIDAESLSTSNGAYLMTEAQHVAAKDGHAYDNYMYMSIGNRGVIKEIKITVKDIGNANDDARGIKYTFYEEPIVGYVSPGEMTTTRYSIGATETFSVRPSSGNNVAFGFRPAGTWIKIESVCIYYVPTTYTLTKGSPSNGTVAVTDGSSAITSSAVGETVYITATPSNGYSFSSWDVYKTGESSTKVSLTDDDNEGSFTMPAYGVTVDAAFECTTPTFETNLSTCEIVKCKDDAKPKLTVGASANSGDISYQWYSNTINSTSDPVLLTDSTKATMCPPTSATGKLFYFCKATNTTDACTTYAYSNITPVTVNALTEITTQPSSIAKANVGEEQTLSVEAEGTSLTYQWYSCDSNGDNEKELDGEDEATLSITSGSVGVTYYYCVVGGSCGSSQTSNVVSITAKNNPTQYTVSGTASICSGDNTNITLSDSEDGVSYQLYKDGVAEGDSEDGTGEAIVWSVSAEGTYTVKAVGDANYWERAMDGSATISFKTATSITTQPTNQEVTVGEEATLTVVAAGTSLSYQWKESATEGGTYSNVASDGTSSSYSVTPDAAGTKWYKCVVTGTCGTETTEARKIVANAAKIAPTVTWTTVPSTVYKGGKYAIEVSTNTDASLVAGNLTCTNGTLSGVAVSDGVFTGYLEIATNASSAPTLTLTTSAGSTYAAKTETNDDIELGNCEGGGGSTIYSYTITSTSDVTSGSATGGSVDIKGLDDTATPIDEVNYYKIGGDFSTKRHIKITLSGTTLAVGDVITLLDAVTSNDAGTFKLYDSEGTARHTYGNISTKNVVTEQKYTIIAGDGLVGSSVFYIGRNGSNGRIRTITITRPGGGSSQTTNLTWSGGLVDEGSVDKTVGDANFTYTASSNNSNGAISYSSGTTSVATINSSTGEVTIVSAGSTTITATIAASGCYPTKSITYTLTVTAAKEDPTVYTVSGTTSVCEGDAATITLEDSDDGVTYQLYKGGVAEGDPVTGTGSALEWEVTADGTYTVKAEEDEDYNEADMDGSAVISYKTATAINTQPATAVSGHDGVNFMLGTGLAATGEGELSYKWYSYTSSGGADEAVVAGATEATYTTSKSAGTYYYKVEVIATCGSVKSEMITVTVDDKHLLTYDANGGTGAPDAIYKSSGNMTLSSTEPTRDGYRFLGWNTEDDGTGDHYDAGGTYKMGSTAATLYAEWGETATLTWNLNVNTAESSIGTASKASTNARISNSTDMANLANYGSLTITSSKKEDLTSKIETPTAYNSGKYMYVTFDVPTNYEFVPTSISVKVQPVGSGEDKYTILDISDENSHNIRSTATKCDGTSGGKLTTVTLEGDETALTGTVTLKIYVYNYSGESTTNNCYRFGSPITIAGNVNYVCPERATITSPTAPQDIKLYTDRTKTLTVEATPYSSGTLHYQWKKDGVDIDGATSASHTVYGSIDGTVGESYVYTCEVTQTSPDACATVTSPAFTIKIASPDCGQNIIAEAVLNSTSTASTLTGGTLLTNGLSESGPYKLNDKPSWFGIKMNSNFQVGDSIIFKLKVGDWWSGASATSVPVVVFSGKSLAKEIYRTAALAKETDNTYVRFAVTQEMIDDHSLTDTIMVYRTATNTASCTECCTQNHQMYSVQVKRYGCPDIFIYDDAAGTSEWSDANNWIGAAGHGSGLPTIDDRVFINESVTVDTEDAAAAEVHLASENTMTVEKSVTMGDVIVETGATLNVATNSGTGITMALNSLSLKGGLNSSCTEYDMPRVYVDPNSTLTKEVDDVNFDISVDQRHYYPIAVPFRVKVSDVNYANSTLATYAKYGATGQYVIKEYDGVGRAENGAVDANWKVVPKKDAEDADVYLEPGKGYILTAVSLPAYGGGVIRFPLKSVDDAWLTEGEQATIDDSYYKNQVVVTAYGWDDDKKDWKEGVTNNNKGWNLLGVPYMSCFASKGNYAHDAEGGFIKGKLNFITGEYTETGNVYVTVPTSDFSEYKQFSFDDADTKLLPGWCFFVQVAKGGTITFAAAGQEESSSLPIYARREETPMPTVKTGIILSGNEASDKTTFLISDKYSAAEYEINADLEKMFGNGYTLATYSLGNDTRLAYNAMSRTDATNVIPIGYRAPAEGEYTFAINPRYAENGDFERIDLIDYETGFVTNLLQSSYTFTSDRTQSDSRFALNVVPQKETPTDIEPVSGDGEPVTGARKVIINDKLYIILNGKMYDAKGVMVK